MTREKDSRVKPLFLGHTSDHHKKHGMAERRRSYKWSESTEDLLSDEGFTLQPIKGGRPLKPILKIRSQEDSLAAIVESTNDNSPKPTKWKSLRKTVLAKSPTNRKTRTSKGELSKKNTDGKDEVSEAGTLTPRNKRKVVKFDRIEVREYRQTLDVHPSCRTGPAIGLGWGYRVRTDLPTNIDEYEAVFPPPSSYKDQDDSDMKLRARSEIERHTFLLMHGFNADEIKNAIETTKLAQAERKQTMDSIGTRKEKHQEKLEEIKWKTKKWLRRWKDDDGDVEDLWSTAQRK